MASWRSSSAHARSGIRRSERETRKPQKGEGSGMKRVLFGAVAVAVGLGLASAHAEPNKVTLQLKWVTQAQFAGYYVALAKGFYKEESLDVTIKPGGPDIAPEQVIAGGGADVIVDW